MFKGRDDVDQNGPQQMVEVPRMAMWRHVCPNCGELCVPGVCVDVCVLVRNKHYETRGFYI